VFSFFFFSSRRRHTRFSRDWSSDVCSSDLSPRGHKGLFSQDDYLAPPHTPTGQPAKDVLNTIWRKNDVYLDIGSYSIGSAVMVIWPALLMYLMVGSNTGDLVSGNVIYWAMLFLIFGIPILFVLYSLTQPVPPPVRFNRQRREV